MTREALHRLVEDLPDEEIVAATQFLEYLKGGRSDPLLKALALAPFEDEEITPEEEERVREAEQAVARGEVVTSEEVRRVLGLSPSKQRRPRRNRSAAKE